MIVKTNHSFYKKSLILGNLFGGPLQLSVSSFLGGAVQSYGKFQKKRFSVFNFIQKEKRNGEQYRTRKVPLNSIVPLR